ncbi:MAG: hypothetical protein MI807_22790, partial [Verrucomicrobiales bacterium]|nr:hypothetical protein [Verrucomicrobiales bacterium]
YESQNVLYASLDAVLGTQIGNVDRASANAFITDSDVNATGDLTVEAVNNANLTSEVSNAATGEASGFTGQSSMAASFILSSNMMASGANAEIRSTGSTLDLDAGAVSVTASDTAVLDSKTTLLADSSTTSSNVFSGSPSVGMGGMSVRNVADGGVSARVFDVDLSGASLLVNADNSTELKAQGVAEAKSSGGGTFGNGTSLAANGLVVSNAVLGAALAELAASTVTVTGNVDVKARNNASLDVRNQNMLSSGNQAVGVTAAFNTLGYEAQDVLSQALDSLLGGQIGTESSAKAEAYITDSTVTADGNVTVDATDTASLKSDLSNEATGEASGFTGQSSMAASFVVASNFLSSGSVAAVRGQAGTVTVRAADVDVSASDAATLNSRVNLKAISATAASNPFAGADSVAVGGVAVMNDAEGGAEATVTMADVDANAVSITSENSTEMIANVAAEVTADGGGTFGNGDTIAANGIIASNTLRGGAKTEAAGSSITTLTGGLVVSADNRVQLTAENKNLLSSGDTAIGGTGAFNTIGYEAQDILTKTIDAIIGTDIGTKAPARAEAYLTDTDVDSATVIDVDANNLAELTSLLTNEATGEADGFMGQSSTAGSFAVASNMMASGAVASVRGPGGMVTIKSNGAFTVDADDSATLDAKAKVLSLSTSGASNPFSGPDSTAVAGIV